MFPRMEGTFPARGMREFPSPLRTIGCVELGAFSWGVPIAQHCGCCKKIGKTIITQATSQTKYER